MLGAGVRDRSVTVADLVRTSRLLHSAGMAVTTRVYKAGHEVSDEMLDHLNVWMMDGHLQREPGVTSARGIWFPVSDASPCVAGRSFSRGGGNISCGTPTVATFYLAFLTTYCGGDHEIRFPTAFSRRTCPACSRRSSLATREQARRLNALDRFVVDILRNVDY